MWDGLDTRSPFSTGYTISYNGTSENGNRCAQNLTGRDTAVDARGDVSCWIEVRNGSQTSQPTSLA